jgi:hypothetical protein
MHAPGITDLPQTLYLEKQLHCAALETAGSLPILAARTFRIVWPRPMFTNEQQALHHSQTRWPARSENIPASRKHAHLALKSGLRRPTGGFMRLVMAPVTITAVNRPRMR